MYTKPPLRVSRLIAQATASAMTINHLAELIKKANEEAGTGCSVNGKMLRNLRDNPQKVGLTWNILVALHTYFKAGGTPGHNRSCKRRLPSWVCIANSIWKMCCGAARWTRPPFARNRGITPSKKTRPR